MTIATIPAQETQPTTSPTAFDQTHALFNAVLAAHVDEQGLVDYTALAADRSSLDAYLADVDAVSEATIDAWTRDERLAFLINAYNAHTIAMILDHWPVDSITETDPQGNPWDNFHFAFLGGEVTLNQIEHEKIRAVFHEPRIHFALVCAAISCPPLLNRAFRAEDLDATLEAQTHAFLANPQRNDLSNNSQIRISELFDWYEDDFGDVISFISTHSGARIPPHATVDFLPYNWDLNSQ